MLAASTDEHVVQPQGPEDSVDQSPSWGKGIMTTVPAWCVSAHASFVFKIDSQKTQCLLIALNKMQLSKKIILYVEIIF